MTVEGKACLVTGATNGHGFAVASALARQGADLIIHGRDPRRADRVARRIERECGRRPEVWLCDLSTGASIADGIERLAERRASLQVLVNNAGGVWRSRVENEDGEEMTMAVNYLSMFQLTLGLLDRLAAGAPARVVNVSSDAHMLSPLDVDDLEMRRRYGFMTAYGRSKLAILYFTRALARRLDSKEITVNALDPGPVRSNIGQNNPGLARELLKALVMPFFPPAERACRTAVYLAASPTLERTTGRYFRFMAEKTPRLAADEASVADALWSWSVERRGRYLPDSVSSLAPLSADGLFVPGPSPSSHSRVPGPIRGMTRG